MSRAGTHTHTTHFYKLLRAKKSYFQSSVVHQGTYTVKVVGSSPPIGFLPCGPFSREKKNAKGSRLLASAARAPSRALPSNSRCKACSSPPSSPLTSLSLSLCYTQAHTHSHTQVSHTHSLSLSLPLSLSTQDMQAGALAHEAGAALAPLSAPPHCHRRCCHRRCYRCHRRCCRRHRRCHCHRRYCHRRCCCHRCCCCPRQC